MRVTRWLVAASTVSVFACTSSLVEGCICSEQLQAYALSVVDSDGAPVPGVTITITEISSMEELVFNQPPDLPAGTYVVMDDTFVLAVDPAGEAIQIDGQKNGATFSVEMVFDTDDCRCHVRKVSGPASVVLDAPPNP